MTAERATVYLCLVGVLAGGPGSCDTESARSAVRALRRSGIPSIEVDAGLAWARILQLSGRLADARDSSARLLDRVQFYRERLPGAISPWYGAHHEALFRLHLDLARQSSGEDLLLAFDRLRQLERVSEEGATEEEIRGQVARVLAAQPAPADELSRQVGAQLATFRDRSGWTSGSMSRSALRSALASMGRDESLLAYLFSGADAYAVTANRRGVEMDRLAGAGRSREIIESLRAAWQDPGAELPAEDFEILGNRLLETVSDRLGDTIYLLASGPLAGFPFDALRLDDRFLARRHRVVNLGSLASLGDAEKELEQGFGGRVFLAGNPRSGRDLFSYGVSTSEEIGAVRDRFVGDGLHIVQGVALRGDEFEDERYAGATLVHLAMPGRIDLVHPERSRFLLSGERESPSAEFLRSAQLRSIALEAELAVLSGTSFFGRPGTDFDTRLGLVNDLHLAGVPQVLAALWPLGDSEAARFMGDFYRALETEKNVAEALFQTRRSRIASKSDTNIRMWAGFQLFIR